MTTHLHPRTAAKLLNSKEGRRSDTQAALERAARSTRREPDAGKVAKPPKDTKRTRG